jgi:hypothetical protein
VVYQVIEISFGLVEPTDCLKCVLVGCVSEKFESSSYFVSVVAYSF